MERVKGIEPLSLAWKAKVMPLYESRIITKSLWFMHHQKASVPKARHTL